MKHDRIAVLCLALALGLSPVAAPAEAPQTSVEEPAQPTGVRLTDQGLTLMGHSVRYPRLEGMDDEALQTAINARLLEVSQTQALLTRLPAVLSSSACLTADYQALLENEILSVAFSALGPVKDTRVTHIRSALNVDLRTGRELTLDDLFTDGAQAAQAIDAYLLETIAPTLSAHLQRSELTPMPSVFSLSAQGLTLHYPIDRLCTLTGRAGAVLIRWCELDGLRLEDGSVLDRIGARRSLTPGADSRSLIEAWAEKGMLPGIPTALGSSVKEATEAYRMLMDPDLCEAGRMFALEDEAFRSVWLITDDLARGWDDSVVQGIRTDCINFFGLCTGVTKQEEWRQLLGQPDFTVALEGDRAEAWRLPEGVSDYYLLGGRRLRLHVDGEGVLVSLFLTP